MPGTSAVSCVEICTPWFEATVRALGRGILHVMGGRGQSRRAVTVRPRVVNVGDNINASHTQLPLMSAFLPFPAFLF